MTNQFHAFYEQDGDWLVGYCPEIPGANGMGLTQEECRINLIEAVKLILQDRYADSLRGADNIYMKEMITVNEA